MSIQSELKVDRDRCQRCRRPLHNHYGGKRTRRGLRLYDGDVVYAITVDVTCAACGAVTSIFYQADMLPAVKSKTRRNRFAWAPTV